MHFNKYDNQCVTFIFLCRLEEKGNKRKQKKKSRSKHNANVSHMTLGLLFILYI